MVQMAAARSPSTTSPAFHEGVHLHVGQWNSEHTSVTADSRSTSHTPPSVTRGGSSEQTSSNLQVGRNLPDLRGLMYPSTNPFAYGNQPISSLEDAHMISPEQQNPFTGRAGEFEPVGSNVGPQTISFDGFNNSAFGTAPSQAMYQPERQDPASIPWRNPSNLQLELGSLNMNVDQRFWPQVEKGRTGLAPGINLDELFGNDGGWNPAYIDQGFGRPP